MNMDAARWMAIAARELGVGEIAGPADNPRILEYHRHTGLSADDDETPWCSAFANWVMAQIQVAGTGKANARSWLDWGSPCEPSHGAVAILWRGDPKGWQGHVGFVVTNDKEFVWLLGGNQGDAVTVARFPINRVLGCRWPRQPFN